MRPSLASADYTLKARALGDLAQSVMWVEVMLQASTGITDTAGLIFVCMYVLALDALFLQPVTFQGKLCWADRTDTIMTCPGQH